MRHQPVANGQQGVGVGGLGEGKAHLAGADDHPANDIDEGDQQPRHRIAADKFAGTVHGPEKGGFTLQLGPSLAGGGLVDQPRPKIGINRHLLAGHGIEGKAGRNLGNPPRTLGDDHEIDNHQYGKDDDPDDEIALHDKAAKGLDDIARRRRSLMAMSQNEAGGGEIESQPDHGGDQQNDGKGGKLQRLADEQGGHQHQHRKGHRHRQQHVKQKGRHGQDENDQYRHHPHRQPKITLAQKTRQIPQAAHAQPAAATASGFADRWRIIPPAGGGHGRRIIGSPRCWRVIHLDGPERLKIIG